MSFVSHYIEHTRIYESPTSFWKWSAYAAIAAVLRDKCYRRQGDILTFPNIYVLFLAQSGARKGAPVNLAKSLITQVNNTKVIAGRTSIQAIIDELAHTETNARTGKLVQGGSAILVAGELAASLVSDPASIGILTDIYDLKTDFKHHLRSTGKFKIDRIVFSLLGASNAELLKEVYVSSAINGGLLARTFLVVPNEYRPPNSLFDVAENKESLGILFEELKVISELAGEFFVTKEARDEYESWYYPFYRSLEGKGDKSGVLSRIHISIFKLSMILAANDKELVIHRKHIEQAIEEGMGLVPNYNQFVMTTGKSNISEAGQILIPELLAAPDNIVNRKRFLQKHWANVDSEILDKLVVTLEQGGLIQTIVAGSEISYQLTKKAIEIMGGQANGKS